MDSRAEVELEPRLKVLPYKVRGVSRESQAQKAAHLLDTDLRTHWSSSTNAKEWLLLELEEPCLLSHIRIHNKSVLEWEISAGLKYKPDTFAKIRPRCEAPRRDIQYYVGYVPCRFVRVSCLRGNPIAIFFIQLIGISIPGLEPEFQPVVDHLLPQIISKQDSQDLYLQLLQDITLRLSPFLANLEGDMAMGGEAMESSIRFLAMLAGPFYPILLVLRGREKVKSAPTGFDQEPAKNLQASVFTVSSNFQAPPRRSRSPVPSQLSNGHALAFRPDVAILLLKVAYKETYLGAVCRMVARVVWKLNGPNSSTEALATGSESVAGLENIGFNAETALPPSQMDYTPLFGEEFRMTDDDGAELAGLGVIDVGAVEEGLLHFLYACASQPLLCRRVADVKPDLTPSLPFVQAMLPALRPLLNSSATTELVEEGFLQWQAPVIQRAVTQIVAVSTSPAYRPLLDACAGYLSSYSPAHEKAACVLIDLCSGPLAPWLPMVVAKVDLAMELVEDLLFVIQRGHYTSARARAALIYVMLGLSGHMDDVLSKYKDVKHNVTFLIEMLEPFLTPAITPVKNTIAFGDVSTILLEKQERTCALSLDLICTAIEKPSVLPALEAEWRRGHVAPSVLLSILAPHVPLPPGIDLCQSTCDKTTEREPSTHLHSTVDTNTVKLNSSTLKAILSEDDGFVKSDQVSDTVSKADANEDPNLLFAPAELHGISLRSLSSPFEGTRSDNQSLPHFAGRIDLKIGDSKDTPNREPLVISGLKPLDSKDAPTRDPPIFDSMCDEHYLNLQAEYLQLVNFQDREVRAAEFIRFATELHSRSDMRIESLNTAIDALLLAAECHLNPFFMIHSTDYEQLMNRIMVPRHAASLTENANESLEKQKNEGSRGIRLVTYLEDERDKAVLHILLKAAEWDWELAKAAAGEEKLEEALSNDFEYRSSCICINDTDAPVEDAVTLVRRHQILFYRFLVRQLYRERSNMYEVLLHGLLFLLNSATYLSSPQDIVDVILRVVEQLNKSLVLLHSQMKEGNPALGPIVIRGIRRQWVLLERLVAVASGGGPIDDDTCFKTDEVNFKDLVPASMWMTKLRQFSCSPFPLVRYIGWKALSRFARSQEQTGVFLASDMYQLTSLLSIFSDDLTALSVLEKKHKSKHESQSQADTKHGSEIAQVHLAGSEIDPYDRTEGGILSVLYPELELLFARMRTQFSQFADALLDAICLQLRSMPSTAVSDILIWFSEICCCPFRENHFEKKKNMSSSVADIKGFSLANAKFIILRLLEAIVSEHMQAIVPELPRVLDVVLSLCCSSYCDLQLLESVLATMKPIISYAVSSAAASEYQLENDSSVVTFEALCFDSLMRQLSITPDSKDINPKQAPSGALLLFLSGFLLSDLSGERRNELMHLLLRWVNFADLGDPNSYYNYLRAFQKIIEGCNYLITLMLENAAFSLSKENGSAMESAKAFLATVESLEHLCLQKPGSHSNKIKFEDIHIKNAISSIATEDAHENMETANLMSHSLAAASQTEMNTTIAAYTREPVFRSQIQVQNFLRSLQEMVSGLGSSLEVTWKMHPQLVETLSFKAAHALLISNLLLSNYAHIDTSMLENPDTGAPGDSNMQGDYLFKIHPGIEAVAKMIIDLQHRHCWQVAATVMDFLLSLPDCFTVSKVLPSICIALQNLTIHSPRLSWRLLTSKWLSKVVTRIISEKFCITPAPLIQLLNSMLDHSEPEQRATALQQLDKFTDLEDFCRRTATLGLLEETNPSEKWHVEEFLKEKEENDGGFATAIVSSAWSKVALLASSDTLLTNRKRAMEVLLKSIPIVQQKQLDEFLISVDVVLPLLTPSIYMMKNGPLIRIALGILARACLYSSPAAVDAISENVWSNLEIIANSKPGSTLTKAEQEICVALLQLREHGEDAKKAIQEVLSNYHEIPEANAEFSHVRETVLEVFARFNAVRLKEDALRDAAAIEAKELEEAEIELELVKQEYDQRNKGSLRAVQTRFVSSSSEVPAPNVKQRLQDLKEQILAEDRIAIRAEVAARRERQRMARRDRQLAIEEASLRELELLHELEREKAAELELEIERQRILEKERAKTRELQHALEVDTEKRTQRELQRELEQRESGIVRSSRKEFPSSTQSRRYHPRGVRL